MRRNFYAYRVGKFHLMHRGLQPECELIESQLQHLFQPAYPLCPATLQAQVEILGGASRAGEAEFHRNTTFEVVRFDHTLLHSLL